MKFLHNDIGFFKSYTDGGEFLSDLSYVVIDPAQSIIQFFDHLKNFLTWSYPFTLLIFLLNSPLVLLTLPIVTTLLTVNTPLLIGAAVLATPALYSFGMALYDLVDCVLSPIINLLKILTNLLAGAAENVSFESCYEFY